MDFLLEYIFTHNDLWEEKLNKGYLKGIKQHILRELTTWEARDQMMRQIADGTYEIEPPKEIDIPKDDGGIRKVYSNTPPNRILGAVIMQALFELAGVEQGFIHPNCKSYLKRTSCAMSVKQIARNADEYGGFKADLSKYFDSVPIEFIDAAFDRFELVYGHSCVIDMLRNYYHNDEYIDVEGNLRTEYKSLKQGFAVASWLADTILYDLDERMSGLRINFLRYCDDIYVTGPDSTIAMSVLKEELAKKRLVLNPKKVEPIDCKHWVKFLGYSIRGKEITLSKKAIVSFKKLVDDATFKHKGKSKSYSVVKRRLVKALYTGPNGYSWASRYLTTITSETDIDILNTYIMDAIRAAVTGHHHIGGIGFIADKKDGCMQRGIGKNVKANRTKIPELEGYYTLRCMRDLMRTDKPAYEHIVNNIA